MPALTLRNIGTDFSAGTDELDQASKLINQAFTGAGKAVDAFGANKARAYEKQDTATTQSLMDQIRGYDDPTAFAKDSEFIRSQIKDAGISDASKSSLYSALETGAKDTNTRLNEAQALKTDALTRQYAEPNRQFSNTIAAASSPAELDLIKNSLDTNSLDYAKQLDQITARKAAITGQKLTDISTDTALTANADRLKNREAKAFVDKLRTAGASADDVGKAAVAAGYDPTVITAQNTAIDLSTGQTRIKAAALAKTKREEDFLYKRMQDLAKLGDKWQDPAERDKYIQETVENSWYALDSYAQEDAKAAVNKAIAAGNEPMTVMAALSSGRTFNGDFDVTAFDKELIRSPGSAIHAQKAQIQAELNALNNRRASNYQQVNTPAPVLQPTTNQLLVPPQGDYVPPPVLSPEELLNRTNRGANGNY